MDAMEQPTTEAPKRSRKKRSDAGKPKPKVRTITDIEEDITTLVEEAVELTRNQAKVTWS